MVAPGWAEYRGERGNLERHTFEVHRDILRREGFDRDRATEIARESSERQAIEVDRLRGEVLRAVPVDTEGRARPVRSGWDIRKILPSALLSDEDRAELELARTQGG